MPHIRANDPASVAFNRMLMEELAQKGFYHSIPLPDGRVLEGVVPLQALQERAAALPLPERLHGKRLLDIGAWDGFFAFEMERRGAEVVALDQTEVENFRIARQLLGSRVDYQVQDVYELSPERNGYFDIVLFMGVLYHLKHPLLGLERVCAVTKEVAIVESFVTDERLTETQPLLEFYETTELLGQADNWCGPNLACLLAMCRAAGFARAELVRIKDQRAIVACYRHWLPEPAQPSAPAPQLLAATHASNYGINLASNKDEYLTAFFKTSETGLNPRNVFPEVGGYGVSPVSVQQTGGDGWQVSFRLAPGLRRGWHLVRLRTANSSMSNAVKIAVDIPLEVAELKILGACDGRTWKPGEVQAGEDARLSLWLSGLPANADRVNLHVWLGGRRLTVDEVLPPGESTPERQVNARLPPGFPRGRHELRVSCGQAQADPLLVRVA
ncbi:MAG: DUF1698 domain-containing protein [Bryobacteraceae bacterium]|nr:DUF1698 domain-containing protein [Bryobacteraceae bacterium]MDW8377917.1 DUF1698 domain-containing protein [Bryobacterales bacterium]